MIESFDPEAYATAMAKALGIVVRPEWRQTVLDHLVTTAGAADLILTFPLDDHVEPAPVFEP